MRALKFDFFGNFAHFKNPEYNINAEFSFHNIPRPTLIGSLGAVLGLKGRMDAKKLGYIEYWEELKDIKIAILPAKARWRRHIEELVNSTGFANVGEKKKGQKKAFGANQILRRELLEDVRWTIYIAEEGIKPEHFEKLVEMLMARKTTYPLYLGKTGFFARLGEVKIVEVEKIDSTEVNKCDSMVLFDDVASIEEDIAEEHVLSEDGLFVRKDWLPISLDKRGLYELQPHIFTNSEIEVTGDSFYADETDDKELIISFL